jgi:hypothetical protein
LKRLVYSPKVNAYVRTDQGIIDISDFIVRGTVNRLVNEASTAEIEMRNPDKQFTQPGNPTFRPMDAITIYLTRLQNKPVQVFTGYLDGTPYLQLYPGTCTLRASCTLKRLLYTYWDSGLVYTMQWLSAHGWKVDAQNGTVQNPQGLTQSLNSTGVTDSGFGDLMVAALNEIGNWQKEDIYVEPIPQSMIDITTGYVQALQDRGGPLGSNLTNTVNDFIRKLVGPYSGGGTSGSIPAGSAGGSVPLGNTVTTVEIGRLMLTAGFPSDIGIIAMGIGISSAEDPAHAVNQPQIGGGGGLGLWQITGPHNTSECAPCNSGKCADDALAQTRCAYSIWKAAGNSFANDWTTYSPSIGSGHRADAEKAIKLGPFKVQGR